MNGGVGGVEVRVSTVHEHMLSTCTPRRGAEHVTCVSSGNLQELY